MILAYSFRVQLRPRILQAIQTKVSQRPAKAKDWALPNTQRAQRWASSSNSREDYRYFLPVQTRWTDNDQYAHMNNVHYISLFDTAINTYMIRESGLLDHTAITKGGGRPVGFCVESLARYHRPVAFPEVLDVGVRVGKIGSSSVIWECAVFGEGGVGDAAATGHFVHVFVDPKTNKKVALDDDMKRALEKLQVQVL
ncbi:hypothetical protein TrST_g9837 [Triparma strigata]|uniref:Thioesterase domain-containing protein n=1 Tax=Triparma strigata TaxID=1606541 RepID=A0A9W7ETV8_9STRA|nr:hypothetical protein TrST_g9837 [Triparma strigata]